MRQVALITLLAQIGSFVPASSARIGICDKIFTRVGASDDLASGQSTFMVEMSEVAHILKNATPKSLVIYDEIGRGTSTFDGLAIAHAVLEFSADKKKMGAKVLFATHYHELTGLEDLIEGVKNYCVAVKKRGDEITFLRKIVRGAADDSYGIEVALLAGVPEEVIKRAKSGLKTVEEEGRLIRSGAMAPGPAPEADDQVSLSSIAGREIVDRLSRLDLNVLTPIEAINLLFELKKKAEKRLSGPGRNAQRKGGGPPWESSESLTSRQPI
jgi:DNA mismatch repair protein MutS